MLVPDPTQEHGVLTHLLYLLTCIEDSALREASRERKLTWLGLGLGLGLGVRG